MPESQAQARGGETAAGRRPRLDRVWAFVLMALSGFATLSSAQSARLTAALSGTPGLLPLAAVASQELGALDRQALLAEDEAREAAGLPYRFAVAERLALSPHSAGTWEFLADGRALWRLRLRAPGATSLSVGFARFRLPAGARLLLHSADLARALPAFGASDVDEHGELWTPLVEGDELVLELSVPVAERAAVDLEVGSVQRGYRDFRAAAAADKSGACNVDVVCSAGDGRRDALRSVALLQVRGTELCSGFLVNNTAQDRRPFLMTARHCGVDGSAAPTVVAYWNYEQSTCRAPGSPASGAPGDGSLALFNSGAILRAESNTSDFTLLELDDPVHPAASAFFAGWDRSPGDPPAASTVHHPRTDEKRISFENQPLTTTSYLQNVSPGDGSHLRVADWDLGTTEGGSSGAPLFSPAGRVIGQLHGGFAACGNEEPDWYGRFSVSWEGKGLPESRLRDWLDPLGGAPLTLDGLAALGPESPPPAPDGLVATALSFSQIGLRFRENSVNENGFEVEMRVGAGPFAPLATLATNTTAATVSGLSPQTLYGFRVRAQNAAGASAYSNVASATTLGGSTEPCVRGAQTACLLGGRFEVKVSWRTASGNGNASVMDFGGARAESDQSAFFWFFDAANFEMGVKMVNACTPPFNRFWIFVSGLTNQEYAVTVRDAQTGNAKSYVNPLGSYPQTIGDTEALPCP